MRVAGLEAADLVVIKVQPLSGVRRSLEVADAAGLPAVVSSALETSVGMAAGVSLAAALPDLPYACGLGTVSLLQRDVVSDPLLQVGGELEVRRPQVDESLLEACRPSREVAEEWMQRLHAAAEEAGIEL
jgi:O-succinylbenzoate synthase